MRKYLDKVYNSSGHPEELKHLSDKDVLELAGNLKDGVPFATPVFDGAAEKEIHNMLELARHMKGLGQMIYASSSSVYGNDSKAPFSEDARADKPVSYYGATKRAGELMAHSYSSLFGLKLTGLRFFTVYGRWGRPDRTAGRSRRP